LLTGFLTLRKAVAEYYRLNKHTLPVSYFTLTGGRGVSVRDLTDFLIFRKPMLNSISKHVKCFLYSYYCYFNYVDVRALLLLFEITVLVSSV